MNKEIISSWIILGIGVIRPKNSYKQSNQEKDRYEDKDDGSKGLIQSALHGLQGFINFVHRWLDAI